MDWLNALYMKIETEKLELEQANRTLQALFKAWPLPDQEKKVDEKTGEQPKTESAGVDENLAEGLTEEEKEGVSLVDKLLQKAQKARDVQKKLEEPKRNRKTEESDQIPNTKEIAPKNGIVKVNQQQHKPLQVSKTTKTNNTKDSQPHLRQRGKDKLVQPNKGSAAVRDVDNKMGENSSTNKSNLKDTNKITVSHKVRSAGKRVTPAHVSAPFQTNPRLTSSKLKTEYGAATGKVVSAARQSASLSVRAKGTVSAPTRRPASTDSDKQQVAVSHKVVSHKDISARTDEVVYTECEKMNVVEVDKLTDDNRVQNQSDSPRCLDITDTKIRDGVSSKLSELQNTESQASREENLFSLSKDGRSLSLPNKLKKLATQNRKLRQKIYTQNVTRKVDSPQPNKQFPIQLHNTFGDPEAVKIQMAASQAEYFINVYKNLSELLESLHLQNISSDSKAEHVLLARKALEYILTTFHETETQLGSTPLGILKSTDCCYGNHKKKMPSSIKESMTVWNPRTKLSFNADHSLRYKAYRQLEKYNSLIHHAHLLQLQIDSMDILAEHTLPLLQTMHPSSSEFIQVLRCTYSMLSTNPNRVPVIVRDTIIDEPDVQEPDLSGS